MLRIAFISSGDPHDKKTWSGTLHSLFRSLGKNFSVTWVGPTKRINVFFALEYFIYKFILRKAYRFRSTIRYAKKASLCLGGALQKGGYDLIFAASASAEIAFLKTSTPIIYLTDATFKSLAKYYPEFLNLAQSNSSDWDRIETLALQNAKHIIVSSQWAKSCAIQDYGIKENKISVISFGANIDKIPTTKELAHKRISGCNLLFLGVNWERKGGQIAYETMVELNKRGIAARLVVVGCVPPSGVNNKNITVIPFLDKNKKQDRDKLHLTLTSADFLILPTRAECSAIVFCEAAAFGIPTITTDTGGISTYVEQGVNGYRLPLEAVASKYAELIQRVYLDEEEYRRLRAGARRKYENDLNWDVWAEKVTKTIEEICDEKKV